VTASKLALLVVADMAITGLLAGLVFLALLFQAAWVWVGAPLALLAAFAAIAWLAKRKPKAARWIVLLAPLSYAAPPFIGGVVGGAPWDYFATVGAYYAAGAALLGGHLWLWAKR
jgi:hypothetical protein